MPTVRLQGFRTCYGPAVGALDLAQQDMMTFCYKMNVFILTGLERPFLAL